MIATFAAAWRIDRRDGAAWSGTLAVCALGIAVACAPESARRALILLAFAPVAEELVFRGVLQESLLRQRFSPAATNVATALAIAFAHAWARSATVGVLVLLPALAIGALYVRRRGLLPCIAVHAAMNLVWLLVAGIGADDFFARR